MLVRAKDAIYRMERSEGQEDRPLEEPEHPQVSTVGASRRAHGIEFMLRLNGMTRADVRDRGVPLPRRLVRRSRDAAVPSRTRPSCGSPRPQARPCVPPAGNARWKRASWMPSRPKASTSSICRRPPASSRRSMTCRGIRTGRCRSPTSAPAVITCTEVMAEQHPELCVALLKGMIKVGRWCNEHKHAAAAILNKPDLLPRRRGHVRGHQGRRPGAEPGAQNLRASRSARTGVSATATSRTTSM